MRRYDYAIASDWKVRVVRVSDSKTVALTDEQSERFDDDIKWCETPKEYRLALMRWWMVGLRNERVKR